MFVSIATSHRPATDLGFVLMKHPDRVHEVELTFGKGFVFFPEASAERCEAVLTIEVDPVGLVRGRGLGEGLLDRYVNDRPYAASSFLAVALNRAFRTAMTGVSKERPELAAAPLPLTIRVTPLPARGGEVVIRQLFEPLGWTVEATRIEGPAGPSRYYDLRLSGAMRVADALTHLFVLIPVLDDDKHYWVGDDEVEKLLAKGGTWLAGHPAKELIAQRYLKNRRALARAALARLAPEAQEDETEEGTEEARASGEAALERPIRLNDLRMDAVMGLLRAAGAASVADLGCGEGKLLGILRKERQFTRIVGLDASMTSLQRAHKKLGLDKAAGTAVERLQLLHGALTYRDDRLKGFDATTLVEVVEHLDADRLPALAEAVFGHARPRLVVVTTPNVEFNATFVNMAPGAMRHPDHRFEWTRAEFGAWVKSIEEAYGYQAELSDIGETHPDFGAPTQAASFRRAQ
ncbi:MAG TPA: 3' terminal RNA ribose 2'-O-methyltransferase Hen1 [Hyphomonadaceae bacterium]|jgi:3' terminal RNA ribose 2'-O-methyltransferase Hen1|nr:3' terminal RNA ribose 2'-O-methyltransferase Hen1 [Hyphomonadaceae bacterium]